MVVEFAINDPGPPVSHSCALCYRLGTATGLPDHLPGAMPLHTRSHKHLSGLSQISYASKFRRGYEQLLRRLLLLPSKPAVILLQAYPWWMSFGDGFWQGLYYREPETELTVLGQVSSWLD